MRLTTGFGADNRRLVSWPNRHEKGNLQMPLGGEPATKNRGKVCESAKNTDILFMISQKAHSLLHGEFMMFIVPPIGRLKRIHTIRLLKIAY